MTVSIQISYRGEVYRNNYILNAFTITIPRSNKTEIEIIIYCEEISKKISAHQNTAGLEPLVFMWRELRDNSEDLIVELIPLTAVNQWLQELVSLILSPRRI